jgi:hypothetical protein
MQAGTIWQLCVARITVSGTPTKAMAWLSSAKLIPSKASEPTLLNKAPFCLRSQSDWDFCPRNNAIGRAPSIGPFVR